MPTLAVETDFSFAHDCSAAPTQLISSSFRVRGGSRRRQDQSAPGKNRFHFIVAPQFWWEFGPQDFFLAVKFHRDAGFHRIQVRNFEPSLFENTVHLGCDAYTQSIKTVLIDRSDISPACGRTCPTSQIRRSRRPSCAWVPSRTFTTAQAAPSRRISLGLNYPLR